MEDRDQKKTKPKKLKQEEVDDAKKRRKLQIKTTINVPQRVKRRYCIQQLKKKKDKKSIWTDLVELAE